MRRISVKFIIFLLLIQANEFEGRKVLHVLRWEDCPEHSNLPISIRSFKLVNYAKNNRTADIRYEIRKKISGNLVGNASLKKCNLSGAPDTCEFFMKDFKFSDGCKQLNKKNQAWTTFVESFKPDMKCPIQPGSYRSSFTVDDSYLKFFPLPSAVWKSRVILKIEDELIACQEFDAKLVDVARN